MALQKGEKDFRPILSEDLEGFAKICESIGVSDRLIYLVQDIDKSSYQAHAFKIRTLEVIVETISDALIQYASIEENQADKERLFINIFYWKAAKSVIEYCFICYDYDIDREMNLRTDVPPVVALAILEKELATKTIEILKDRQKKARSNWFEYVDEFMSTYKEVDGKLKKAKQSGWNLIDSIQIDISDLKQGWNLNKPYQQKTYYDEKRKEN